MVELVLVGIVAGFLAGITPCAAGWRGRWR